MVPAICRSFRMDCAIPCLSTEYFLAALPRKLGMCWWEEVLLLGRALPNKLGIQEAEFIFLDRCFAVAVSYSAHGVWEPAWESNMVNNLLFKAVEIGGLIGKMPHGNLRSSWVSCGIRAEFVAGPPWLLSCGVTSPPGESRCSRVVIQVLVILPNEPKASAAPGESWGLSWQQSEAPVAEEGECLACPVQLAFPGTLLLTRFQLCFGIQFAFSWRKVQCPWWGRLKISS